MMKGMCWVQLARFSLSTAGCAAVEGGWTADGAHQQCLVGSDHPTQPRCSGPANNACCLLVSVACEVGWEGAQSSCSNCCSKLRVAARLDAAGRLGSRWERLRSSKG